MTCHQTMAPEHGAIRQIAAAACALAAAMGIGRFSYTPILPLMTEQASLSPALGAFLASSNYLGYLLGMVLGTFWQRAARSRASLRTCSILLVLSLAVMPLTRSVEVWLVARTVAGALSALLFLVASHSVLEVAAARSPQLAGWAYGGVGAGIVLSGLLVAGCRQLGDWRLAWAASAAAAAALLALSWNLATAPAVGPRLSTSRQRTPASFVVLCTLYFLEGAGYIIAGTFLVAAVQTSAGSSAGVWTWILVGLAALPSCVVWARLSTRISRPVLLGIALGLQAIGMSLPALHDGLSAALASAVLFGGTFMGITTLALAEGRHLGTARAVAILSVGYSLGQILGPIAVAPFLHHGHGSALLVGAGLAAVASGLAFLLARRTRG